MQVTNNISLSTPKITQKFIEEREKNREENKKLMQTLLEERTKLMQAILEVPGGELVAFLLPSEKYPNKFLAEISLENMRYLVNVGRIKNDVIDEHSQKFTNVSEESYQSAKAYIYKQMEDIALAIYEEEGDSGLLGTLMEIGRFRQIIDIAEDIKENKLESSARELAWVLKTEDKEKIAKAQERIEIYLDKMWNANTVGLAITIHFFTLVDSKIPAENFQKIKDSLGIMRNYIENNFIPNEQGIIKTKNGLIIESSEEKGIRTLKITLPFDKVENLILNYKDKNHQTLLEMFEYKEKLSKDSSINSKDSLIQTLLKESKEERKEY